MDALPLWMQIAALVLLVLSLGASVVVYFRGGVSKDDGLGWKILLAVGIPAVLLCTGAIAILAMKSKGGSQDVAPAPPSGYTPPPTHSEDAVRLREHVEDEAKARGDYFRDAASDDEVGARGAALFGATRISDPDSDPDTDPFPETE